MFDVEDLRSHYVPDDSVEVVILYIGIVHAYQKASLCIILMCFSSIVKATNSCKLFIQNSKY
jgi:hypothetical protein